MEASSVSLRLGDIIQFRDSYGAISSTEFGMPDLYSRQIMHISRDTIALFMDYVKCNIPPRDISEQELKHKKGKEGMNRIMLESGMQCFIFDHEPSSNQPIVVARLY